MDSTRLPLPEPASSSDGGDDDGRPASDASEGEQPSTADAPHREAMQRLRAQIERAVAVIEQLREQNQQLREALREERAQPRAPEGETLVAFDEDPEAVRDQVRAFIETIDAVLDAGDVEDAKETAEDDETGGTSDGSTNGKDNRSGP